jgi:hypothetical protein
VQQIGGVIDELHPALAVGLAKSEMVEPPGIRRRRLVRPEGSRPHLGALLLGYYTDDDKLIYAGRVGTGMPVRVLADLRRRLEPLARKTSPLNILPPRKTRFGSPLVLSRVHPTIACGRPRHGPGQASRPVG